VYVKARAKRIAAAAAEYFGGQDQRPAETIQFSDPGNRLSQAARREVAGQSGPSDQQP
jgi:hypothetical protein